MDGKQVMLRGYMSHSIRGKKGDACPPEEVEANCAKAAQDGAALMALFQRWGLPVHLYVPGVHDDFVQKAYKAGYMTEKQILDTDCEIIADCDFLLQYDWQDYISGGMKYEADYCDAQRKPILIIKRLDQRAVWYLQYTLTDMLLNKWDTPNIIKIGLHDGA